VGRHHLREDGPVGVGGVDVPVVAPSDSDGGPILGGDLLLLEGGEASIEILKGSKLATLEIDIGMMSF